MKKEVDTVITKLTPLKTVLMLGKKCDQDGWCCQYDGGIVLKEEVEKLAKKLGVDKKEFEKSFIKPIEKFNTKHFKIMTEKSSKPYGKCIFLANDNKCSIHDSKPLHCRVGNCSEHGEALSIWFTLNYFVNPDDPESIRQWATYLKTHPTIPGGKLEELVPNKEQLRKILNFEILR